LKSKYNFYNVKCNRQLIYLKNELELLKDKSTKSKEKMTLFIKLVKKYAKNLSINIIKITSIQFKYE
jgi:hypothetical protein